MQAKQKISILKRIQEIYDRGENIINFLNNGEGNSAEDIMISYDFQAGSYVSCFYENYEEEIRRAHKIAGYIKELNCECKSIFEGGVGQATKLVPILNCLGNDIIWAGGRSFLVKNKSGTKLFEKRN